MYEAQLRRTFRALDKMAVSFRLDTEMPKVKVLKGVAHNIGDSFTSLMNYRNDDYSLGHVLRFARESGIDTLTIDLLSGQGSPASLLREPISDLPSSYSKMFHRLVKSAGSAQELIQSATLTLVYDLQHSRPGPIANEPQSPFTCDVCIVDVRGKSYAVHFDGWWHIERVGSRIATIAPRRRWWNPCSWLRSRAPN
jgi:hypothetical protein